MPKTTCKYLKISRLGMFRTKTQLSESGYLQFYTLYVNENGFDFIRKYKRYSIIETDL